MKEVLSVNIGIFTDTYYPEINGVANSSYQLKNELEHKGHNVYVFTATNPNLKEKENNIYRMHSLPFILMKDRRVSFFLTKSWIKTVESLHLDVIHTQTEFCLGHMGRKLAKYLDIPLVHTYHTIYEDYTHYLHMPENMKIKEIVRTWSRNYCNKADLVIVPTEKVKKLLKDYGVERDIVVQSTGVDTSKFALLENKMVQELKTQYGLKPTDHILLFIGRLSKEKNIQELIEFVEIIHRTEKNVKLLIVGDGPEKLNLMKQVEREGLNNNVIFTGEVEWKNIQNYYSLGDVFVCGSTSETQGLTYIEALASGKPLLVRRDECLKGILQEGINGYGYESENEFIKQYKKLYDKNNRESMALAARASSFQFTLDVFAQRIESAYQQVVYNQMLQIKEGGESEAINKMVG